MVKGEVEGDLMIRPRGAVEEGTAGGMILMTGRLVIGGVVGTAIGTCRHRTRVGVATEEEETSMTDEGEPTVAKNIQSYMSYPLCTIVVCVCVLCITNGCVRYKCKWIFSSQV